MDKRENMSRKAGLTGMPRWERRGLAYRWRDTKAVWPQSRGNMENVSTEMMEDARS